MAKSPAVLLGAGGGSGYLRNYLLLHDPYTLLIMPNWAAALIVGRH